VIINADDFGLNSEVNAAILDLLGRSGITSVTMLGNAPAIQKGVKELPKNSRCSFGVHLNLTEFAPLTPRSSLGELARCLDEGGCFLGENVLRSQKLSGELREAMFMELKLQVERILSHGVQVSHFDSHNHVHTLPGLLPVLKRLQKHFGVRKVRTTQNVYPLSAPASWQLLLKKKVWDFALRHYHSTTCTSAFTSFAVFYDLATKVILPYESIELMVHPGHKEFQEETDLLRSSWQDAILFPIKLITYDEL
jgi:predicted glycoside hydrolase/deacetylase ChbG (UPF0249 family)